MSDYPSIPKSLVLKSVADIPCPYPELSNQEVPFFLLPPCLINSFLYNPDILAMLALFFFLHFTLLASWSPGLLASPTLLTWPSSGHVHSKLSQMFMPLAMLSNIYNKPLLPPYLGTVMSFLFTSLFSFKYEY